MRSGRRKAGSSLRTGAAACMDWGAVEGEGPLQDLLGQLQFGSRVGLVGVLLWRQWQFSSAVRRWRRQQCSQEEGERAAGQRGDVRALFQRLNWRETRSSRGFVSLTKRRGRKGKKREASGPVWVVQLVGALLYAGNRLRDDEECARWLAKASGEADGVPDTDVGRSQAQGDIAETELSLWRVMLDKRGAASVVEYCS